ncbi:hypothetical protein TrLO_g979 [Triparma laevis f. longispina]|uniref:Uncharacterized protein n=1 Tax=Triparma laevis f. longispina TaxID=1714387 RepID=A0A9W6ZKM7_9STRA|nr:hypothetical protein TrLO_g979 [Triparma laevis f. longispina]
MMKSESMLNSVSYVLLLLWVGGSLAYYPGISNRRAFIGSAIVGISLVRSDNAGAAPTVSAQSAAPSADKPNPSRGAGENGAIGAAFKLQNEETNARLAKQGISLGSEKEQDDRLSNALSSFSYESSVGNKNKSKR